MLRNCAFGSDNFAPTHPLIMRAMVDANEGFVVAYGGISTHRLQSTYLKNSLGQIQKHTLCLMEPAPMFSQ